MTRQNEFCIDTVGKKIWREKDGFGVFVEREKYLRWKCEKQANASRKETP